mmetsp:Transcript_41041/g.123911  ORF Transcript_41041/g.123911 Transcript_41041/m.123911 type:complete len:241 (-) Transcript_41041:794-1516(-)
MLESRLDSFTIMCFGTVPSWVKPSRPGSFFPPSSCESTSSWTRRYPNAKSRSRRRKHDSSCSGDPSALEGWSIGASIRIVKLRGSSLVSIATPTTVSVSPLTIANAASSLLRRNIADSRISSSHRNGPQSKNPHTSRGSYDLSSRKGSPHVASRTSSRCLSALNGSRRVSLPTISRGRAANRSRNSFSDAWVRHACASYRRAYDRRYDGDVLVPHPAYARAYASKRASGSPESVAPPGRS